MMSRIITVVLLFLATLSIQSCGKVTKDKVSEKKTELSAKEILGNPDYLAISYGGYRENSRDIQPTVDQIKEDLKIMKAMGVKVLRTYNTKLKHASTVLEGIKQLKAEDPGFEMYVMLGAWIDCENAFTPEPNHNAESLVENTAEIERAVAFAKEYPDIVKIIAVGNEAMVKWATSYFVQPEIILKWVNYLQELKKSNELPADLWITSSDNFASWGGGGTEYHNEDLEELLHAVDYVSVHTYPYHDTHYNPDFWGVSTEEEEKEKLEKISLAMLRARDYAIMQYNAVVAYMKSLGIEKPVHIGETGWATVSNGHYGPDGSKATDEYKSKLYYDHMRQWTRGKNIACFYFEAFDEIWKDQNNPLGSENHFGLITIDGKAKFALWDLVDAGVFEGLSRDGNPILKTYNGDIEKLMKDVETPIKMEKTPIN